MTSFRQTDSDLAAAITRAASSQTDLTIRYLVDQGMVADAYRTYGYFRWVDDWLDQDSRPRSERLEFVARDPGLVRILGTVVVSGEDTSVRLLEFRHSQKERVEIVIDSVRTGVIFTPEEAQRYFR